MPTPTALVPVWTDELTHCQEYFSIEYAAFDANNRIRSMLSVVTITQTQAETMYSKKILSTIALEKVKKMSREQGFYHGRTNSPEKSTQ